MADIGAMLREARMRAQLDVSELEARTKIRAKYLRALENEEWDLLPGSTFTKSFLRTYADALGVDSRFVVEEYKLRHERLSDVDLQPIRPLGAARSKQQAPRVGRGTVALAAGAALVVVLVILGLTKGGSAGNGSTSAQSARSLSTAAGGPLGGGAPRPAPAGRPLAVATLRIVPAARLTVCLRAASGRALLNGAVLAGGSATPVFRSRRFSLTLSSGAAALVVNGRRETLPPSAAELAYSITAAGRRSLPAARRATCP